jgi:hypothetical protein
MVRELILDVIDGWARSNNLTIEPHHREELVEALIDLFAEVVAERNLYL